MTRAMPWAWSAWPAALGIIVPPSFPMVLYGVTNGVSIGDMFLAGWGPSFVVGGVLIFINWLICKKRGYKSPIPKETSLKLFVKSVWEGKWALLMPIIILGRHLLRRLLPHRGRRGLLCVRPDRGPVPVQGAGL